ncbi:hypothetical protein FBY14_104392 [Azospirillum brasilense]|nr:hypothetical protein FBY14_104392 [Azospirillum brasilense]
MRTARKIRLCPVNPRHPPSPGQRGSAGVTSARNSRHWASRSAGRRSGFHGPTGSGRFIGRPLHPVPVAPTPIARRRHGPASAGRSGSDSRRTARHRGSRPRPAIGSLAGQDGHSPRNIRRPAACHACDATGSARSPIPAFRRHRRQGWERGGRFRFGTTPPNPPVPTRETMGGDWCRRRCPSRTNGRPHPPGQAKPPRSWSKRHPQYSHYPQKCPLAAISADCANSADRVSGREQRP